MTSKYGAIFLLLFAITNEKTVKLTQIDRIPAASRASLQKHVPITPVGTHKVKGKVFYGQQPPSGDSTTTECGVNYQLLAVIPEVAQ